MNIAAVNAMCYRAQPSMKSEFITRQECGFPVTTRQSSTIALYSTDAKVT